MRRLKPRTRRDQHHIVADCGVWFDRSLSVEEIDKIKRDPTAGGEFLCIGRVRIGVHHSLVVYVRHVAADPHRRARVDR